METIEKHLHLAPDVCENLEKQSKYEQRSQSSLATYLLRDALLRNEQRMPRQRVIDAAQNLNEL